jgi:DNA-binding NarL/FixJ family response regulator
MSRHNCQISVLVAEDHPVVLHGIVSLLRSYPDITVVAECSDGHAAVKGIKEFAPDVAVLDMAMPGHGGLEVLSTIAAFASQTRVIFLTATATESQILTAIARGAKGILHKDVASDELMQSIRKVAQGNKWYSETVAEIIDRASQRIAQIPCREHLSVREKQVTQLASTGLSNKGIARSLYLTEGTVKVHLHNIFQKLGVPNRTALTALAIARPSEAA